MACVDGTRSYAEFCVSANPGSKALPIDWLPGFLEAFESSL